MKESFSFPADTPGVDSARPFDTESQGKRAIGTLEDMLNFAALKGTQAKHLHETATYLAARQEVGDNEEIKLAEITFEALKENLQVVLEDCEDCGLNTGLESTDGEPVIIQSTQLVNTTFMWMKQLVTENYISLTRLIAANSRSIEAAYQSAEALRTQIQTNSASEFEGFELTQTQIANLLTQPSSFSTVGDRCIEQAVLAYSIICSEILAPVDCKSKDAQQTRLAELKAQIQKRLKLESLESTVSHVVAKVPGGANIELSHEETGPVLRLLPNEWFGSLQEPVIYKTLSISSASLLQCVQDYQALIRQFEATNDALKTHAQILGEQYAIITTLIDGVWYNDQLDDAVFSELIQTLIKTATDLKTNVEFIYQFSNRLSASVQAAQIFITKYLERNS